jgi:hypothetical protein
MVPRAHCDRLITGAFVALTVVITCPAMGAEVDYLRDIKPILKARCYTCHGSRKQESNLRLDTAAAIRAGGDSGAAIVPNNDAASLLLERVASSDESDRMPPEGEPLAAEQIKLLRAWISAGGLGPQDEVGEPDPKTHWAFQPLTRSAAAPAANASGSDIIDPLITVRLQEAGLQRNRQADAVTLIRRLFLDLHGLPPTVEEIRTWSQRLAKDPAKDPADDQSLNRQAINDLVDFLLGSSRYGERWAQHWLDVVRYADTHGFEVNTPRDNAWPYRDYVIRALNEDKPYNEFIVDQLAGDTTGEDAATGFLVAAPVLLPGQIGKDDISKRLARQDSLDEIIVGTTATFIGVTLGCARCHDHKFDPFTQEDYYAMQAFFAGVEYGDREVDDGTRKQRLAAAAALSHRITKLTLQLRRFEPLAYSGRTIIIDDEDLDQVTSLAKKNGHGANPAGTGRGYLGDVGDAVRTANLSRGRYTWWTNKPAEDVFTWNPATEGRFRIWISWGAHGSGVHTRDARYLLDLDGKLETQDDQHEIARIDQYYFSGISEGTSETKPLWSGLFDAGVHQLTVTSRLVLRGGDTGTGITADVVVLQELSPLATDQDEAAPDTEAADQAAANQAAANNSEHSLPRLRAPVSPLKNIERFPATDARFVRFTTFQTIDDNRHQPCLDELEIFRAGDAPINVALAEHGTKPTSSGNYSETGIHQLKHVNDGKYGNSHSWISNQHGSGWVQLEFPRVASIDRIEWSRDREGKFKDRLPIRYQIDVSADGQQWSTVARSDDRVAIGTPHDPLISLGRSEVAGDSTMLPDLISELESLQTQKTELEKPTLVYGGIFRTPDKTSVLRRGDPEQPLDEIAPRVPLSLGDAMCAEDAPEAERRIMLAKWIASEDNPLTARVLVNRIWQKHFGRGLVDTASDFGLNGARPTHPELLDRLAIDFIQQGWSIKRLHRLILTSATYQQSSRIDAASQSVDADTRLLWRFPSRRLEAEAIRDSMLAVSGQLNLKMGGPGFSFFKTRGGLSGFPPRQSFSPNELRRMIYSHRIRMELVPVFGAFDCPDAGQATPTRSQSTTAIQALNLFNSPFVVRQSELFAARVHREAGDRVSAQVDHVWLLAVGRRPTETEAAVCVDVARDHGLATVCRVLFNSNEFLFMP